MSVAEQLHRHRILEGLPRAERELIIPACEVRTVHLGDIIEQTGEPIRFLHFPLNSAISVTNIQDKEHMVEVTVTGKEGCTGASIVLGNDRSPCMALIQIGGEALRIPASSLEGIWSRLPYLKAALSRYSLLVLNLAVISVGCSQFHSPLQRLARWLLTHWHRTGIETFPFSSDFLAAQVGVEPKVVAEMLDDLERGGVVRRGHNKVSISQHEALEEKACPCYSQAKESTEEYLRGLTKLAKIHADV